MSDADVRERLYVGLEMVEHLHALLLSVSDVRGEDVNPAHLVDVVVGAAGSLGLAHDTLRGAVRDLHA
jgi:hypothetical protein